jgi:hypothetical protein
MTCSQENLSINSTYQIAHTYYRTFLNPHYIDLALVTDTEQIIESGVVQCSITDHSLFFI